MCFLMPSLGTLRREAFAISTDLLQPLNRIAFLVLSAPPYQQMRRFTRESMTPQFLLRFLQFAEYWDELSALFSQHRPPLSPDASGE